MTTHPRLLASLASLALIGSLLVNAPHAAAEPTPTPPAAALTAEQQASEQAKTSQRPVAVDEATTQTSTLTANPDGTFTLATSQDPQRIQDRDGTWQPINTEWELTTTGAVRQIRGSLDATLSNGGTTPLAVVNSESGSYTLTWPYPLPAPTLNGNRATYRDVLPGVDLVMIARPNALGHVIVVNNAQAANNPGVKQLRETVNIDGLNLTKRADGSTKLTDDTTGQTELTTSQAAVWDSTPNPDGTRPDAANEPDGTTAITSTLTTTQTSTDTITATQTITTPQNLLTGPDVIYPVYIDPQIAPTGGNFTTFLSGSTIYTNYGWRTASTEMRVGYCNWAACNGSWYARSHFETNIAAIAGATITNATLSLWETNSAGGTSSSLTPVNLYATSRRVTTNDTKDTQPTFTTLLQTLNTNAGGLNVADGWVTFNSTNITNYIQTLATKKTTYATFGLKASNETANTQYKKYLAANNTLTITYYIAPPAPTTLTITNPSPCITTKPVYYLNNPSTPSATSAMTAVIPNSPNMGTSLKATITVYRKSDNQEITHNSGIPVANGGTVSWAPNLPTGGTYYYTVFSNNGINSPTTTSSDFYVPNLNTPTPPTLNSLTLPTTTETDLYPYGDPNGTITITRPTGSDLTGITYTLDGSPVPTFNTNSNCTTPNNKLILFPTNNDTITLTPPTIPGANQRTLKIKGFNPASTQTDETSYTYNQPDPTYTTDDQNIPGESTNITGPNKTTTTSTQYLNNQAATFTGTTPTTITFTTTNTGDYDITIRGTNTTPRPTLKLDDTTLGTDFDGTFIPDTFPQTDYPDTTTPTISIYHTTALTPGTHTLQLTPTTTNTNTTLIDYTRITRTA